MAGKRPENRRKSRSRGAPKRKPYYVGRRCRAGTLPPKKGNLRAPCTPGRRVFSSPGCARVSGVPGGLGIPGTRVYSRTNHESSKTYMWAAAVEPTQTTENRPNNRSRGAPKRKPDPFKGVSGPSLAGKRPENRRKSRSKGAPKRQPYYVGRRCRAGTRSGRLSKGLVLSLTAGPALGEGWTRHWGAECRFG